MTSGLTPLRVLESCLYAEDLPAEEEFYTRILGLEVYLSATRRELFLRCGDGMVLIFNPRETGRGSDRGGPSTNPNGPDVPRHGATGAGHLAFAVPADELDHWREHLHKSQVAIESEVHWPNGAVSLYFRDPAGNCLELAVSSLWDNKPWEVLGTTPADS